MPRAAQDIFQQNRRCPPYNIRQVMQPQPLPSPSPPCDTPDRDAWRKFDPLTTPQYGPSPRPRGYETPFGPEPRPLAYVSPPLHGPLPCPAYYQSPLPPPTYPQLGMDDLMELDPIFQSAQPECDEPEYDHYFDCLSPETPPPIVSPCEVASPRIAHMADEMRNDPSGFMSGIVQAAGENRYDACQDRIRAMDYNRRREAFEPMMLSPEETRRAQIPQLQSPSMGTPISQMSSPSVLGSPWESTCPSYSSAPPRLGLWSPSQPPPWAPSPQEHMPCPYEHESPSQYSEMAYSDDSDSPTSPMGTANSASSDSTTESELKRRFGRRTVAEFEGILNEFTPPNQRRGEITSDLAVAIRRAIDEMLEDFILSRRPEEQQEQEDGAEDVIDLRTPEEPIDLCSQTSSDVEIIEECPHQNQYTPASSRPGGSRMCPRQLQYPPVSG